MIKYRQEGWKKGTLPKIDIPIKKLIQRRPADWAKFIQPNCKEEWVTSFKTNYNPKKESRLDSVLEITDPNGPYLLNLARGIPGRDSHPSRNPQKGTVPHRVINSIKHYPAIYWRPPRQES